MHFPAFPLILLLFTKSSSCIPTATQEFSAVPISKQIASLSIEFCYIVDYLGDNGSNKLSKQLLQNIQDISGVPPLIRIGGHTQDAAKYCSDCSETLVNVFVPGNLEAVNVTYNKNLFSILNNHVPSEQQFIFGLNLGQDIEIFPQEEVEAAEQYLRDSRVQSYELGNEPDFYGPSQRAAPWNVQTYTSQVVSWIKEIQASTKTKRGWQFGALAQEAQWQGNFSIPEFNVLDVPENIKPLVAYSDHTYPYSICSSATAALVSLPGLMNHTTTVNYFTQWIPSIQAAHSVGTLFYMGETGSVSCHGKNGVSNTMGAALWELDYVLNGATIGMDGVFFHMGTPFYYSMWQPVEFNSTAATVYPTCVSFLSSS
ncbi:glycoside hydrolase family 79 protein [Hyaloscypha hepaticicola]|uniref:Glycoside hydrolase family 79 protein n=1 Tax=Hyaloscypha hepaticicola TaxID=2082293 RepID=A0A2J6PQG8_9HELO|nr:glycoside hydrolase family 79 protein [Hyaloscypha hepaticicola]